MSIVNKHRITFSRSLWTFIFSITLVFIQESTHPVGTRSEGANSNQVENLLSINNEILFHIGSASHPSISSDGRFIAFISNTSSNGNLEVSSDFGIFIQDLLMDEIYQLPIQFGSEAETSIPITSRISADGRFITFSTIIRDLPSRENESAKSYAVFLHDRLTGDTQTISIATASGLEYLQPLPTISHDGRFVAFTNFSQDSDSQNKNNGCEIQIYDRVRNHHYYASNLGLDKQNNNNALIVKLSDDGRSVIYHTNNLPNKFGHYNRVTNDNTFWDFSRQLEAESVVAYDISADGNILTFISRITTTEGQVENQIYLHDFTNNETFLLPRFKNTSLDLATLAISGSGDFLVVRYPSDNQGSVLFRYNINSGVVNLIDMGMIGPDIDLNYDGSVLVYSKEVDRISKVHVWKNSLETELNYILAGQVTDSTGQPLALVTIRNDRGRELRTDGSGRFWFNGITPGLITLQVEKEGYIFSPPETHHNVNSDIGDLLFVYAHHETLLEAQKDLGMPYSFNRGENGSFHGFSAGYCTDLILDAYTWGVDFNIQFALEQDYRAHPWHFYRWRDARNAHDMWRYFSYSGQLQPHENPYQTGDIVFFDWSEDGEIDHVALVSEVDSRYRPTRLYDATGVINTNPSGLAAELPWVDFHEQTVRGFARWSGKYEPVISNLPQGQMLHVALSGASTNFLLKDSSGNVISASEVGIRGGHYENLVWEQSISLNKKFSNRNYYRVVITNPTEKQLPYQFTAQFMENGIVSERIETKGMLNPGNIKRFPLILRLDSEGEINLEFGKSNRRIEGGLRKRR